MVDGTNLRVFCFIRIIECILSSVCLSFHIFQVTSLGEADDYYLELAFRMTYLGFVIFSGLAAIANFEGIFNLRVELVSVLAGFIFFISASILAMVGVEYDGRRETLTKSEEMLFKINRFQSVIALIAGLFFLLHATFLVDLILNKSPHDTIPFDPRTSRWTRTSETSNDLDDSKPLKLHFFPITIFYKIFGRHHRHHH